MTTHDSASLIIASLYTKDWIKNLLQNMIGHHPTTQKNVASEWLIKSIPASQPGTMGMAMLPCRAVDTRTHERRRGPDLETG
jgi:hypothetical protein